MRVFLLFLVTLLIGCHSSKKIFDSQKPSIGSLRFLGVYEVPFGTVMDSTIIGGLSGIDYDIARDQYYLICDDPSTKGPARFYTARINLGSNRIDTVIFTAVTPVLNPEGKYYSDITKDLYHSADLESMRYDPKRDVMVRGSEGQRRQRGEKYELQNAEIIMMDRQGRWLDSFALPSNLYVSSGPNGPRHNGVFEGLDFDDDHKRLFVSVEEALIEDWERAGLGDSTSWIRILEFDMNSKKPVAQYAYEIGPVPHPPGVPGGFRVNGVSDIMYLGMKKFLFIERAYSSGRKETDIKIYLADFSDAEDVSNNPSFLRNPVKNPVRKTLLLDMNASLEPEVYNVEGMCLGPRLPNGRQSLLLVSDDNFNPREKTQFFLFEIVP